MFIGMTLVRLIGMGLCMFGLTTADGFPRGSLWGPSVLFGTEWNTSITKSREWEREYRPCVNLHREKWYQLLQNCVKLKSFLHIPLIGTNVCASENTQDTSWCWFWVFKVSCKIRVLIQVCMLCCVSHIIWPCVMNVREMTRQAFGTSFCPFCHSRAKVQHFRTIWEHTVDNSPTHPISSCLNWWSSMRGVATSYNCWVVLLASSHYLSTHFFAWPSMS